MGLRKFEFAADLIPLCKKGKHLYKYININVVNVCTTKMCMFGKLWGWFLKHFLLL